MPRLIYSTKLYVIFKVSIIYYMMTSSSVHSKLSVLSRPKSLPILLSRMTAKQSSLSLRMLILSMSTAKIKSSVIKVNSNKDSIATVAATITIKTIISLVTIEVQKKHHHTLSITTVTAMVTLAVNVLYSLNIEATPIKLRMSQKKITLS